MECVHLMEGSMVDTRTCSCDEMVVVMLIRHWRLARSAVACLFTVVVKVVM